MLEELKSKLLGTNECLSISSPNNSGKSTLLRKLARLSDTPELLVVYLDFNLRADNSTQAFYELVQRQLLATFKAKNLPSEKLEGFYRIYASPTAATVTSFNLAQSFLAAIDEALQKLSAIQPYQKLVLLFDEFDQPLAELPGLVLLQLRALKDRYPKQLSYVIATDLPILACGREEQEEGVAEFYELFSASELIRLGGLSLEEASALALEIHSALAPPQLEQIYQLAGGHPVLTRLATTKLAPSLQRISVPETGYASVGNDFSSNWEEVEQILRLDPEIRLECARLWRSLPENEQQALLQYLEGIETISLDNPLGSLIERGLVVRDAATGTSRLFARVFEWFVQEKFLSATPLASSTATNISVPIPAAPVVVGANGSNSSQIVYDPRRVQPQNNVKHFNNL